MSNKTCKNCRHWGGIHHKICSGINLAGDHIEVPDNDALIKVTVSNDYSFQALLRTGPNFSCAQYWAIGKQLNGIDAEAIVAEDEDHFSIHGEKFIAKKGDGYSDCDNCVFGELNCMRMAKRPSCDSTVREDGRSVYFKRVS